MEVSPFLAPNTSLGTADVAVDYGADWTYQPSTANNTALGDYHETTKLGASINITLHQTSAVTVYGIRSLDAGRYIVSLDNSLPTTHIAKASFESRSVLYFASGLDPKIDHHLVLTNVDEGAHFAISSINTTTVDAPKPENGPASFSVPKGTLIALITAVVAAVIIIILIGICILLRRRRIKAARQARLRRLSVVSREYSSKPPSFMMNDEAVTKSRHDPVILVTHSHGHSYDGSLHSREERYFEGDEDEEDGSFQFVRRPLLSTPSLKIPHLGEGFHVDFPSFSSAHSHSRQSSQDSTVDAEHQKPNNRDTSDQTNFLHLNESSGSTDAHSYAEKHRSRVRFSTPPLFAQLFKHPFAAAGGQAKHPFAAAGGQTSRANSRTYQRSSRSTLPNEPNTPMTGDSFPFTVGTSVAFEHPRSTPPRSLEEAREESTSEARDVEEGLVTGGTDTDGFIPHSARPWRVSG
ncbi:hypothetical protein M408DRAFT_21997 [Serendipita vermifera MAFF 305830]|uniref:Transmembrane protein n=1 Tax=Serendipita vermifera MAFF 305830 TaxID=933852 RepID=A0A0C2XND3_SERVB|nr:hypothetical protein M408DRAFT_21997 [Serendipita vermifera MAFF 305830]